METNNHNKKNHLTRESDKILHLIADSLPMLVFYVDKEERHQYSNKAYEQCFGMSRDDIKGRHVREVIGEHSYESIRKQIELALSGHNVSCRKEIALKNGELFYGQWSFVPHLDGDSEVHGFHVHVIDITRRKKTEKELKRHQTQLQENQKDLQKLAGRLILNQEEELKWLARELHDDLSQRLAVMSIDAGNVCQKFKDSPERALQGILNMKEQLVKMAKDIHNLSRQLHPSIIDDLGLVRAVESECDSFSTRMAIAVIFTPKNISNKIPADISLCIYRIIQECLSNIAKHANTKNAYVFLECSNNSILLTVRDTGKGFDYAQVRKKSGLGLASMRERVRLVNGSLSIISHPGEGTVVNVVVPEKTAIS